MCGVSYLQAAAKGKAPRRPSACSALAQDTLFRSSPRGAPRDSKSAFTRVCDALCVAGTPLRGPSTLPWIPAFAGMSGVSLAGPIGNASLEPGQKRLSGRRSPAGVSSLPRTVARSDSLLYIAGTGEARRGSLFRIRHRRSAGPRGGVVTQRSAKPCTPVQFRAWPPNQSTGRVKRCGAKRALPPWISRRAYRG